RLAELGEVKVLESKGSWKDVQAPTPLASGVETVVARKVIRRYSVRTRLASCFCSSCQISKYDECHINSEYPNLVPKFKNGEVREKVIMDTGVRAVGVGGPEDIKFGPRQKTCTVSRVSGTQWHESDQIKAQDMLEEPGWEEEPASVA
ncbi:unnamed protein product, partial [Pylaiella littoralis]